MICIECRGETKETYEFFNDKTHCIEKPLCWKCFHKNFQEPILTKLKDPADKGFVYETRVTDPETGGQKGVKAERFDLIPVGPLEELARVYGFGATKYDDNNWRKGYSWKLSFGAMLRHAFAFWRGETYDKESKLHHLAHVAWHCMTLMWYTDNYKKGDDRADSPVPRT